MALAQTQVTTNITTAAKLVMGQTRRRGIVIKNTDATNNAVIGSSTVTAAGATGGLILKPNDSFTAFEGPMAQEEWWAIAAVGTPIISVVESLL